MNADIHPKEVRFREVSDTKWIEFIDRSGSTATIFLPRGTNSTDAKVAVAVIEALINGQPVVSHA